MPLNGPKWWHSCGRGVPLTDLMVFYSERGVFSSRADSGSRATKATKTFGHKGHKDHKGLFCLVFFVFFVANPSLWPSWPL